MPYQSKRKRNSYLWPFGDIFTSLSQLCFLPFYPWILGTFHVFVIPLYLSCRPSILHQAYCQLFLIPEFLGTNEGSEITGQNDVTAESSALCQNPLMYKSLSILLPTILHSHQYPCSYLNFQRNVMISMVCYQVECS